MRMVCLAVVCLTVSVFSIGAAAQAPVDAYNARILKLNLAKRFPLDKVPLKKCA